MRAVAYIIIGLAVILVIVAIFFFIKAMNDTIWKIARREAKWEDFSRTQNGYTDVGVQCVARSLGRQTIIGQETLKRISVEREDWMLEVQGAVLEASNHANVLNGNVV